MSMLWYGEGGPTRIWFSNVTIKRLASEGVYDIFGSHVAGCSGGIGTSAESADRRIKRTQAHIQRGEYVGERCSVRVVELCMDNNVNKVAHDPERALIQERKERGKGKRSWVTHVSGKSTRVDFLADFF